MAIKQLSMWLEVLRRLAAKRRKKSGRRYSTAEKEQEERSEWSRLPPTSDLQTSSYRRRNSSGEERLFSSDMEKSSSSSSTLPHKRTRIRTNPWFSSVRLTRLDLEQGGKLFTSSFEMGTSVSSGYGSHDSSPGSSPESSIHTPGWAVVQSSLDEVACYCGEESDYCDCSVAGSPRKGPPRFVPPPPPPLCALTAVSDASRTLLAIDAEMAELEARAGRLKRSISKARAAREERLEEQAALAKYLSSGASWRKNFEMAL